MAKLRAIVVDKLQKSSVFLARKVISLDFKGSSGQVWLWGGGGASADDSNNVDNNNKPKVKVKVGHFAVFAVEDEKTKRFVVPLSYLSHPGFLRLLEEAAEEFGFVQKGAVCVVCQWAEMEQLLAGTIAS